METPRNLSRSINTAMENICINPWILLWTITVIGALCALGAISWINRERDEG